MKKKTNGAYTMKQEQNCLHAMREIYDYIIKGIHMVLLTAQIKLGKLYEAENHKRHDK